MGTAAQKTVGFLAGCPTSTTVPVLVVSLTSANVTVSCNGSEYTVTLTELGTDRGSGPARACYYGHATITGLSPATRYAVSVSQSGTTETDCAVVTAPAAGSTWRLFFASCDNPGSFGGVQNGAWSLYKPFVDAGGLGYCLFVDDFCYAARDVIDDTAGSGHSSTGVPGTESPAKQYNYALAYANALGLLGDSVQTAIAWGRGDDRLSVMRRTPMLLQWGDWEFRNDLGWDGATSGDSRFTAGKAVWDALFGPLTPTRARNLDTAANHWAVTLGNVRIGALDNVTNGSGGYVDYTTAITTQYGNNQIDDFLDAMNVDVPFKIVGMALGDRYLGGTADEFQAGQQHPLFDHCPSEYQRLWTGSTGLVRQGKGGCRPKLIAFHGDTHRASYFRNRAAASAGQHAENWDSWFIGTINGSTNFGLTGDAATNCVNGGSYGGTEVVWTQDSGDPTHGRHLYHGLWAEVTSSQTTVSLVNSAGTVAATQTYAGCCRQ